MKATKGRLLLALLVVVGLPACKLKIIVPDGGSVVWGSGDCGPGAQCTLDVSDQTFDETFTAVPELGFRFAGWRKLDRSFCSGDVGPCRLFTTTFNDHPALTSFLASNDDVFSLAPVFEPEAGYDVEYWRTALEQVDGLRRSQPEFLYAVAPNIDTCDPGVISVAARNRALLALNKYRELHDLPPVVYRAASDLETQSASLIQRANNTRLEEGLVTYLSHYPVEGDLCFSQSGFDGASSSNLGTYPQPVDPVFDVIAWANDNFNVGNVASAGHRRWLSNPFMTHTSYGQVNGFAAMKVLFFESLAGQNALPEGVEFVAYPYREFPFRLVTPGPENPTPWSFSWIQDLPATQEEIHDFFASASVSVVHEATGTPMAVTDLYSDTDLVGLANFLSWNVTGWDFDELYTVTISDITLPDGITRTVRYPVRVDRFNLVDVTEPVESGDSQSGSDIAGNLGAVPDADSYQLQLSGPTAFSGQSRFSNQAFFIRIYDARKRLVVRSDEGFEFDFPEGEYTLVVSQCDSPLSIFGRGDRCYAETTEYSVVISPR